MGALLRLFCLAYPREFRARYAAQIVNDFNQREREERSGFAHTLRLLTDIVANGLQMRAEFVLRDIGNAVRRLRKAPLLVCVIVLTFTLGIGANVAAFSVLNAVLLRPLPYPNSARLISFGLTNVQTGSGFTASSIPDVNDFRAHSITLDDAAGFTEDQKTLTGHGKPQSLNTSDVTFGFFDALGTKPELGRFFTASDATAAAPNVIVISSKLWRSSLGANPRILGGHIMLDGTAYEVIGIAPPGFQSPQPEIGGFFPADVWTLLPKNVPPVQRGARDLSAIGLVRQNVSIYAARADMSRVLDGLRARFPRSYGRWTLSMEPLRDALLGKLSSSVLWSIFGASGGVFLIMCANIASLLLTQSAARRHELAMRTALGASRARITTQLLTESGVLAFAGGIFGLGAAYFALKYFGTLASEALPRLNTAAIDLPVLAYAVSVVVLATLIAGSAPAWLLASAAPLTSIRGAGRSGGSRMRKRIQAGLVAGEIAIALAVITASGLAVRSFYAMAHADLGIGTSGIVATQIYSLPDRHFPTADVKRSALGRLQEQLNQIPAAQTALASSYPLSGASIEMGLRIANRPYDPGNGPVAALNSITPDYFRVLSIPLRAGRVFSSADNVGNTRVAIVSAAFARYLRPGENPIGMRIQIGVPNQPGPPVWRTIVGEVADDRDGPTALPQPTVYLPLDQAPMPWITAIARVPNENSAAVRNQIASAFAALDPFAEPPQIESMGQILGDAATAAKFSAALLSALGLIGICLALSGVFGVVSYSVAQRFQEFGIRMAIGSTAGGVVRAVLGWVIAVVGIGVGFGLVLAALAGRALGSQLYQVQPADPLILSSMTALMVAAALVAAALPTLRAARIDPAAALRYE